MSKPRTVPSFLDAYRAAFEALDAVAIAELFAYPCGITGAGAEPSVTVVTSRDSWVPQLERLVAAYRAVGVRAANLLAVESIEFSARVSQATVRWRLTAGDGSPLYDFDAAYTLADLGDGPRITGLVHNETDRLRAALAVTR